MQTRHAKDRRGWLVIVAPLVMIASPAMAADDAQPAVDPAAIAALEKMGAYLRQQQQMHVISEMTTDEVLPNDQKIQHTGVADLKVRRPDRLLATIESDRKSERIVYDGKTITIFEPKLDFYASTPAPPTIGQMLERAEQRWGLELPLADLFYWGTGQSRVGDILSATNVGVAVIKGVPCDHYAFHQPDVDWELWIERGPRPLPHKEVITTITEKAQPQHVAVLSWDLSPKLDESLFAFTPPPGAHRIGLETVTAPTEGAPTPAKPRAAAPTNDEKGGEQ
jgi:hypothetical protein